MGQSSHSSQPQLPMVTPLQRPWAKRTHWEMETDQWPVSNTPATMEVEVETQRFGTIHAPPLQKKPRIEISQPFGGNNPNQIRDCGY